MKKIVIGGSAVSYIHKKSDRRTISAFVNNDGCIEVRSPKWVSDGHVQKFIREHESKILQMIERSRGRREYEDRLGDEGLAELRRCAEEVIPQRVQYYSKIMNVTPTKVRINEAKTRFGSCSGKGSLNFSCRVMAYSAKAVDYVVVHELAHLLHMNHGSRFWSTVAKYMPDYNEVRKELKDLPGE